MLLYDWKHVSRGKEGLFWEGQWDGATEMLSIFADP